MNIIIRGGGRGFGSTWGCNFYMGTQNGSKLDLTCIGGLLIHTFELEISIKMFLWWPLTICTCTCVHYLQWLHWDIQCLYREAMHLYCMQGACLHVIIRGSGIWLISRRFFLLSVDSLEKKQQKLWVSFCSAPSSVAPFHIYARAYNRHHDFIHTRKVKLRVSIN